MEERQIQELRLFVEVCRKNPSVLYNPQIRFFKDYLESLGAHIPPCPTKKTEAAPPKTSAEESSSSQMTVDENEDSEESEVELEKLDTVEPDEQVSLDMGDDNREITDEDIQISEQKRSEAEEALENKEYARAQELYTEAIVHQPSQAFLHVKRAVCFLQLNRPNAAIQDCNKALQLNPDSAAAHKFRGRAYRLLGEWEKAAQDLRRACQFDYNEEANRWLQEIIPNVTKLEAHNRKYERKRKEKDLAAKREEMRRIREEREKAAKEAKEQQQETPPFFQQMFNDPEFLAAMKDPEVMAAFMDVSKNPGNFCKYANNPKILSAIMKLSKKFGASDEMPFGFPGASADTFTSPETSKCGGDLGLD